MSAFHANRYCHILSAINWCAERQLGGKLLYTARSLSIDTPSVILTAMEPSSESGCRAKVRPEQPTRTLAPAPRPRPMSPDAPIYSPASAPAGVPWVGAKTV